MLALLDDISLFQKYLSNINIYQHNSTPCVSLVLCTELCLVQVPVIGEQFELILKEAV